VQDEHGNDCVVFRKLIRDKIPEILKKEGKTAFTEGIKGKPSLRPSPEKFLTRLANSLPNGLPEVPKAS